MSNFMNWALSRKGKIDNSMSMSEFNEWIGSLNTSSSGVPVTEQSAMRVSAVYACVALIGGAIASLPLPVYSREGSDRKRVDHDYWKILNRAPSVDYPAAVFWESLVGSLLLNGDGFARIIRPSMLSPRIIGLDWLKKSEVQPTKDGNRLIYVITRNGKTETVMPDDMVHVPGPGFNGLNGMSQISYVLRNSAGIALAADEYSGSFFKNGARPDFALEIPGEPTEEQQAMMRKSWSERYGGYRSHHLPAIIAGGVKIHELTMNAEDAQLLTTRQFQVEDIARIFGVPPHMIGHTQNNTSWGTGVEQMSIGFVKYTLNRHLTKIEQELNRKMWPSNDQFFVEFNTAGLERGDYKTRMEGYRVALGRAGEPGWMTVNEIRKLENQSPVDGGNEINKGLTNESTAAAVNQ